MLSTLKRINPRFLRIPKPVNEMRIAGVLNCRGSGNREVVGYGVNGTYTYYDSEAWPFPAIRFRENTPEILALREKERGDWRRLSNDEKKCLYRASFCLTFAEITAPTGEWKFIIAGTVYGVCAALWLWIFVHLFVHTKAPKTFSEESRAAQYWRQEALNCNPITGNYKPKNADKYKPDFMRADDEDDGGEDTEKNKE